MKLVITAGLTNTTAAGKYFAFLTADKDTHAAFLDHLGNVSEEEINERVYRVINLPNTPAGRAIAALCQLEDQASEDENNRLKFFLDVFRSGKGVK